MTARMRKAIRAIMAQKRAVEPRTVAELNATVAALKLAAAGGDATAAAILGRVHS